MIEKHLLLISAIIYTVMSLYVWYLWWNWQPPEIRHLRDCKVFYNNIIDGKP